MKIKCECGGTITNGKHACARCLLLEGCEVDAKMTESWTERRARKKAGGLADGDKFPMLKIGQSVPEDFRGHRNYFENPEFPQ